MPMYTQDHATYCRQMYDWHMQMVKYQDQKRTYHLERANHYQQFIGGNVVPLKRPDGVA